MANSKFTSSVMSAFISELASGLKGLCSSRSHYLRAVCEKVGISHTTFYRHMRRYRALEKCDRPLTSEEKSLVLFGRQVDTLVSQLRVNRRQRNLRTVMKSLNNIFAENAAAEAFYRQAEATKKHRVEKAMREKKEKKISSWEQRTEQITSGMRCFEFKSEKSQKNM